jgi:uncharacterized protein (DUF58 family)
MSNKKGPAVTGEHRGAITTNVEPDVLTGAYVSTKQLLDLRFRAGHAATQTSVTRTSSQAGLRLSKHKGRGIDFAEVRQYQPGDDIRSIDWRVTARKNSPHTKVFREERESPALLFVDQTQPMFFGSVQRLKSVAVAELAGRLAWLVTHHGDRVGGLVLDRESHHMFRPFRTVKATGRFLQQVATSNRLLQKPEGVVDQEAAAANLQSALNDLIQLRQQRFRVFIIADLVGCPDLINKLWQEALPRIARKHQVTIMQVGDPLDQQLPPAGFYSVSQGDSQLNFHSGSLSAREAYAEAYRLREDAVKGLCRNPSINYLSFSTADTNWDRRNLGLASGGRATL